MSLRARLVAGLVVLMAAGLLLFGWVTYDLYSSSQYHRLDDQLRASVPLVTRELAASAGVPLGPGAGHGPVPGGAASGAPPPGVGPGAGQGGELGGRPGGDDTGLLVSPGTYGELVDRQGRVVSHVQQVTSRAEPRLPHPLPPAGSRPTVVTVGSTSGSERWRASIGPSLEGGYRVAVAVPMSEVTSSLDRLLLTEVGGGLALLVVLSIGAVLVLRRGLAPLERMAATADLISAGDLSRRVGDAAPSSEVGKLGQAFNGMLDQIESAFAQRDATEARLRQFLADASHELKTPLTSIQGFAELHRLGTDQMDTATMMRRIESESARMRSLVEDLLLLARLDETRRPDRQPVDLAVLAADACSDATAVAPDRAVTLAAPTPVVVSGDEGQLRQAIGNLVANAIRHTPAGGPIEVDVHEEAGAAVLSVRDHGPGLDEETEARAFDRFWQGDPSRAGAGAGLGLAIVAAVAAAHGGRASAGNAAGGGAVFSLRLPRSGSTQAGRTQTMRSEAGGA